MEEKIPRNSRVRNIIVATTADAIAKCKVHHKRTCETSVKLGLRFRSITE